MTLRVASEAEKEYAGSALYYLEASPPAALAFIEEVEEALIEITEAPERYPYHVPNIRVRVLDTYPFSIFYRVIEAEDEVLVLSISHQSREPSHWSDRV
jgi:plasmid stabilization system protein ParE